MEPRNRRAILVGALLTTVSPLFAQTGRVRIRVTDVTGAVVSGAEGSLLGADNKPKRTVRANDHGEIVWTDLPMGNCRFRVTMLGFRDRRLTVTLRNSDEVKIEAQLEVGALLGEVITVKYAR